MEDFNIEYRDGRKFNKDNMPDELPEGDIIHSEFSWESGKMGEEGLTLDPGDYSLEKLTGILHKSCEDSNAENATITLLDAKFKNTPTGIDVKLHYNLDSRELTLENDFAFLLESIKILYPGDTERLEGFREYHSKNIDKYNEYLYSQFWHHLPRTFQ